MIIARYLGDATHDPSSDRAAVLVTVRHPTETSLQCSPPSVEMRHRIGCIATVTDLSSTGATKPVGEVRFQASAPGSFSQAHCSLAGGAAHRQVQVHLGPAGCEFQCKLDKKPLQALSGAVHGEEAAPWAPRLPGAGGQPAGRRRPDAGPVQVDGAAVGCQGNICSDA